MKVTFIGHATCLIETGGKRILTDPIWAKRLFFLKRLLSPGRKLETILPVDFILLSHAHFDHLDAATLKQINKDAIVVCSKHLGRILQGLGFSRIFELDWWQTIELPSLKVTSVPAKHFGGRWQLWDRILGYGGFILEALNQVLYFAGDTAYFDLFKNLGKTLKIDLALLPIGAYQGPGRTDFRRVHMDPEQAVRAFADLRAKYFVPIHYGTYRLSVEPPAEPELWLREITTAGHLTEQTRILKPGLEFKF